MTVHIPMWVFWALAIFGVSVVVFGIGYFVAACSASRSVMRGLGW